MGTPLLVEFYDEIPEVRPNARPAARTARRKALEKFQKQAGERYTEGTLLRVLQSEDPRARRAAVLALGTLGTMAANRAVAARLRDGDRQVRAFAVSTLWSIWFRGDTAEHVRELQRLLQLEDTSEMIKGLTTLIKKAPRFAEAYNQRAIALFRVQEYHKAIADCERTLERNPFHFGAHSGMAQCYMKLRKPQQALRAFRNAFRIHPGLDGVEDTIRALEEALGEEGKR